MSADYGTEHLKGYHHDDGVYVVWRVTSGTWGSSESEFGFFYPEIVAELQSITDQWKSVKNDSEG